MLRPIAALALWLLAVPAAAQTLVETLTAGTPGDHYGTSVAITTEWLAVGAPEDADGEGRVHLYERDGAAFLPAGTLAPSGGLADVAGFGAALDLEGDELVVAAPDGAVPVVFFFEHDGARWNAADSATSIEPDFGRSVAIDDGRAAVGRLGGAEVFERARRGWSFAGSASPASPGLDTGEHVDLSGATLLTGGSRAVFFERVEGVWTQVHARAVRGDVAILGTRALLGHENYQVIFPPPQEEGGGALVLERLEGSWTETAVLHEETALSIHDFGQTVALADGRALVADLELGETAYFELVNGQWTTSAVIDTHCCGDRLSLDLCGSTIVAGFPFDAFPTSFGRALVYALPFQFSFLGTGVAGTGGSAPVLDGAGCAIDGGSVDLTVTTGLGGAPGLLLAGLSPAELPFYGGTLWVGTLALILPHTLDGTPGEPFAGTTAISLPLPAEQVLVGVELFFQAGYVDPGALFGVSLSNAVRTTIE